MLVDENGHAKGLPHNRRAGELYGPAGIVRDALICQEHRFGFWIEELSVFTREEAEQMRDFSFAGSEADAARQGERPDALDNRW